MWVSARYRRPAILITENGCDMLGEDDPRSFDARLFSFPEDSDANRDGDGESLESLLSRESEAAKSLLMDDFRRVI
jgi:hypothetical protein